MTSEILATVIRGDTVESIHRGHLAVIDGEGKMIASLGDPTVITFFRSSSKAFQAIPCITSGAADRFHLTEDEIALAAASHSGEEIHVEIGAKMLQKIGLSPSDLRCGTHLPFNRKEGERMLAKGEKPTELHNNCSGKHSAMLAFSKHIGADIGNYDDPAHPVQQAILKCVSVFTEIPVNDIAIGIDGCAVPNFAVPLSALAKSFANLTSPPDTFDEATRDACRRVVAAMIKLPEIIGGTDRLDTMIMQAAPGRVISKVGADGVWLAAALPSEKWPTGLGIALKVEDGDDVRGRPVAAIEVLRQLGVLNKNDLAELSPTAIKNRRGDIVGRVVASLPMELSKEV